MYATVHSEASDPRDKIFALLGLFVGAQNAGLVADYSLSKEQVFSGVMAFLLVQNPRDVCRYLSMVQPRPLSNLPSWVIDWSSYLEWPKEEALHVPGSVRHAPVIASAEDPNAFRFDRSGGLWVAGVPLFPLDGCVFTDPAYHSKAPGIIKNIAYHPTSQKPRLTTAIWAQKIDKVFAVAGLPHHLMVLRPVSHYENKYNFVAICERPKFENRLTLHTLHRSNSVLISTWNYILGDSSWHTLSRWQTMEDICSAIEECWKLLESEQSRSSWTTASELLEDTLAGTETTKSSPQPDFKTNEEENVAFGRQNNTTASRLELLRENLHRLHVLRKDGKHWPLQTSSNAVKMNLSGPSTGKIHKYQRANTPGTELSHETPWNWAQNLSLNDVPDNIEWLPKPDKRHRKDERELDLFKGHIYQALLELEFGPSLLLISSPSVHRPKLLESLLGQRLDMKIHALSFISRKYHDGDEKFLEYSECDIQWLWNSVELREPLREDPGLLIREEHREPSWGENFLRAWTLLTRGDISGEERAEFFLPSSSMGPVSPATKARWAPLLDLVGETRAQLFPLKEDFMTTFHYDAINSSPERHRWEDICII
ncbi:hypothetical protein LX32DRAFT_26393 [Colletotrichum zoysiae]|uniref:Uncharacterized protein n=1 Tax=Colletotrichum zoysiae TaxID=1216348 RepID=A0AAD9HTE3_9PEZI|nr:hypothetical protein LX32DRAFT_26393 [Colletotrichum zoysiae]